jgi:hypothetical protein
MVFVYAVLITGLNLAFWVGMLCNRPGTWLMVPVTAVLQLQWWPPGACPGELPEFAPGAVGSRHAGCYKRAAALAINGGVVGGIVGTALPVPLVGTLIGACLGAFAGSLLGDLWAGHLLFRSVKAGCGVYITGTPARI